MERFNRSAEGTLCGMTRVESHEIHRRAPVGRCPGCSLLRSFHLGGPTVMLFSLSACSTSLHTRNETDSAIYYYRRSGFNPPKRIRKQQISKSFPSLRVINTISSKGSSELKDLCAYTPPTIRLMEKKKKRKEEKEWK